MIRFRLLGRIFSLFASVVRAVAAGARDLAAVIVQNTMPLPYVAGAKANVPLSIPVAEIVPRTAQKPSESRIRPVRSSQWP